MVNTIKPYVLILDGPKGTGKSTLAKHLAKHWKDDTDIIHLTMKTPNTYSFHQDSISKALVAEHNTIFDRFYLDELVYPIAYKRLSKISTSDFYKLFAETNKHVLQVILYSTDLSILIKRIEKRDNTQLTKKQIEQLRISNALFKRLGELMQYMPLKDKPNYNTICFDINKSNVETIAKENDYFKHLLEQK